MEYRGSDAICAQRRSTGAGPTCRALQETCKIWFSWLLLMFCCTFKLKRFICFILYSRCYNGLIVFHRRLMARPWCFYGVTWSWSTWGWNWVLLSNFAITLRDSNWWNSGWNLLSKNTEGPLEGNGGKRRSTPETSVKIHGHLLPVTWMVKGPTCWRTSPVFIPAGLNIGGENWPAKYFLFSGKNEPPDWLFKTA